LAGDVEEPPLPDLEPVVDLGLDLVPVVRARDIREALAAGRRTCGRGELELLGLRFQDDVDHAGNGVGAILRRGAVAQHLDPVDGRSRDRVQVHAHRASAERPVHVHQRARVPPLAVDEDEHLVGPETQQARRVDVV